VRGFGNPSNIVLQALNLIPASDLLHAAVISVNRDGPTAMASVAALVSVAIIVSVMALTPTWTAEVNACAALAQPQFHRPYY
jgi:hypothetical protein